MRNISILVRIGQPIAQQEGNENEDEALGNATLIECDIDIDIEDLFYVEYIYILKT